MSPEISADGSARLAAFEAMLVSVQAEYADTVQKMNALKAQGKAKTATYRQLMGRKISLQDVLILYQCHGLLDDLPRPPSAP